MSNDTKLGLLIIAATIIFLGVVYVSRDRACKDAYPGSVTYGHYFEFCKLEDGTIKGAP